MARSYGDDRYELPDDQRIFPDGDEIVIRTGDSSDIGQVTVPQVTANQNDYPLPSSAVVLFSTDVSRNFTGFAGARPGLTVFCNTGTQDGVIVHNSASSALTNRVLCHTGANITLNGGESAILIYDYAASRWRTVGFS